MDTFKIKALVAAVKYKSLSKAAEEFSYTPSAFSHIMTGLEGELGVPLLKRSHSGVSLTSEGEKLYPQMLAVLEAEAALASSAAALHGKQKKTLRIATYSSISRTFLSDILKDFRAQNPDIRLSVDVADSRTSWLEQDRADIVFADGIVFEKNEWYPIMEDEFLAVAPLHMLGERETVSREELYVYPNIYTDDTHLRSYFDVSKFQETIFFRSEDDLSIINMVRAGMGIAILPALVLKDNAEGVHLLHLSPPLKRTIGFAYRKDKRNGDILSRFLRFIQK